ncbi:AlpA family transcriptional regulator [Variovorax sp. 54]|uniref:helix-turn-helix transcriptional regulator n=1 Tax=Variovorax sp. 54 TaxID=2035212 RepID=UPI000C6BEA1A|nr:AlpA family transcriptional regulator [Variovorax sp. 54]
MQHRMVSLAGVLEKLSKSRSSVYDMLNPRSKYFDKEFPQPVRLGQRSVRWFEDELDGYLTSRPRSRHELIKQGSAK